jgi:uncharacterized protein (TIGR03032 family)
MRQGDLDKSWTRYSAEWRDGAQITSQWREANSVDPRLLVTRVRGRWRETLESLGITLLVTREYEHLLMGLSESGGRMRTSYLPVPHPSGLVADRDRSQVHLASTRNPNQVFLLRPITAFLGRHDINPMRTKEAIGRLTTVASSLYPGSLYLHDLALIDGALYGSATGHNAVVRLSLDGRFEVAWWPKCIEDAVGPDFSRNYIQLNSIAAGPTLADSFFTASTAKPGRLRPGHLNYPVDRRGVIFSAATGEAICMGLTRPHSARFHQGGVWVANSGYGEIGFVSDGRLEVVRRLPGWTRGLCLVRDVAFVGVSRVIPKYSRYAPGLDPQGSQCGVYAISSNTGEILGSIRWPHGNQIFALDWIGSTLCQGCLFEPSPRRRSRTIDVFSSYLAEDAEG